jgi:hypothetical protein
VTFQVGLCPPWYDLLSHPSATLPTAVGSVYLWSQVHSALADVAWLVPSHVCSSHVVVLSTGLRSSHTVTLLCWAVSCCVL